MRLSADDSRVYSLVSRGEFIWVTKRKAPPGTAPSGAFSDCDYGDGGGGVGVGRGVGVGVGGGGGVGAV